MPGAERRKWIRFLAQYASRRAELRLLVHLIDGELFPPPSNRTLSSINVNLTLTPTFILTSTYLHTLALSPHHYHLHLHLNSHPRPAIPTLHLHSHPGEVGPQETDLAIMRMVRDARALGVSEGTVEQALSPFDDNAKDSIASATATGSSGSGDDCSWEYAIALTKGDKGGPRALKRARQAVHSALAQTECPQPVAVVVTSSRLKEGRSEMWRLMRSAVLDGTRSGSLEAATDTAA